MTRDNLVGEEDNLEFSDVALGPKENRWVRARMFREHERRKQMQAWLTIPPAILALFSAIGIAWGWVSGFFNR